MARLRKYANPVRISFSTDAETRHKLIQEMHKRQFSNISETISKLLNLALGSKGYQNISDRK